MTKSTALLWTVALLLPLSGCTYTTRVNNAPGRPTVYEDTTSVGAVAGIGMESVITSYSIHYTKLYEALDGVAEATGDLIEVGWGVITSYSIHYTKLYEFSIH